MCACLLPESKSKRPPLHCLLPRQMNRPNVTKDRSTKSHKWTGQCICGTYRQRISQEAALEAILLHAMQCPVVTMSKVSL